MGSLIPKYKIQINNEQSLCMTSTRDNLHYRIRNVRNFIWVHKRFRANCYRGVEKLWQKSKREYFPVIRASMLTCGGIFVQKNSVDGTLTWDVSCQLWSLLHGWTKHARKAWRLVEVHFNLQNHFSLTLTLVNTTQEMQDNLPNKFEPRGKHKLILFPDSIGHDLT